MKTDLYYFSGTGNGLFIAKTIKEQLKLHTDEETIITSMTEKKFENGIYTDADRVGLIYPTYDGDAPNIVREFARHLSVSNNAYVFIYNHSAGFVGNSIPTVKKILENRSITTVNAFTALYPDNSALWNLKPDIVKKRLAEAKKQHSKDIEVIYNKEVNLNNSLLKFSKLNQIAVKFSEMYYQNYIGFKDIRVDSISSIEILKYH